MSLEAQNHVINNISSDKIQIKDKVPLIKEELDINSFTIPESRKPYLKSVLVPEGGADSRIEKLAQNIAEFYQDRKFICLILLRGGAMEIKARGNLRLGTLILVNQMEKRFYQQKILLILDQPQSLYKK
ncbi:hypothetical protein PPERSA_08052 [Pseudocohnilembus persalinus]|uniref:Uncharacterized protein n=1 Tax=Pseudocohnilembus persalinus TaxID=266149 RepID=A0A0V0R3G1_PSEPJ|nr:hypothetical protein PPERSA_08052 [Pseudocohnilembus persalinus]|eukprot:KRX08741.1 hypothetical protein PPERSA_08052 [Pseudocohnilembus persalinus]